MDHRYTSDDVLRARGVPEASLKTYQRPAGRVPDDYFSIGPVGQVYLCNGALSYETRFGSWSTPLIANPGTMAIEQVEWGALRRLGNALLGTPEPYLIAETDPTTLSNAADVCAKYGRASLKPKRDGFGRAEWHALFNHVPRGQSGGYDREPRIAVANLFHVLLYSRLQREHTAGR